MATGIYRKPIFFALVSAAVISVGTLVTMLAPMLSPALHPRLETLNPYNPLELYGKDIYQREGCNNCHTQTVRPLKTEVMRYGEYSKAGEFTFDQPHLWGSKRTGPDLARVGAKYPDAWHYMHFEDPRIIEPESNMPAYAWLQGHAVDPQVVRSRMDAMDLPYGEQDISALSGKNEMDALVAYMLSLGHAVIAEPAAAEAAELEEENPVAGDHDAIERGEEFFESLCAACHGKDGHGIIGPSLVDKVWLGIPGDIPDGAIFTIINGGTRAGMEIAGRKAAGGMPEFGNTLGKEKIWDIVAYIRSEGNE